MRSSSNSCALGTTQGHNRGEELGARVLNCVFSWSTLATGLSYALEIYTRCISRACGTSWTRDAVGLLRYRDRLTLRCIYYVPLVLDTPRSRVGWYPCAPRDEIIARARPAHSRKGFGVLTQTPSKLQIEGKYVCTCMDFRRRL